MGEKWENLGYCDFSDKIISEKLFKTNIGKINFSIFFF